MMAVTASPTRYHRVIMYDSVDLCRQCFLHPEKVFEGTACNGIVRSVWGMYRIGGTTVLEAFVEFKEALTQWQVRVRWPGCAALVDECASPICVEKEFRRFYPTSRFLQVGHYGEWGLMARRAEKQCARAYRTQWGAGRQWLGSSLFWLLY